MAEQMMQHKPAKQTIPAGYKQTEVGVIPEDWDVKSIGETMTLINGYGFKPYQWMREGLPIIRIQNLNDDDAPFNYYDGIVDSRFYINEGDLLFAWSGSKGSSFGARVWSGPRAILNQHIFKVVANNSFVESDFAYLILRSVQEDIEKKAHGFKSSFVHVKKGDLENTELPIPPKQEQTAIANVLLDSDALIDALEQLIAKKQAIKTAVMQQLLTGRARLPQFALRPDGTPKGYKTSELGQIPEDWDALTYGDIHTKWNNKLDLCVFDLPRVSRHLVSSSFVENGDVIMADASEDYDGIGKSVEICNVGDDKIVSGLHTFLLRDKNKLLVDGYRGFLHSIPAVKKAFDRLATGMKVYGISKNNLIVVPVPLPPKQEQTAIATILTDMDSELTALEQKLAKARDVKQGMMQQLLTGRIRLPLPQEA